MFIIVIIVITVEKELQRYLTILMAQSVHVDTCMHLALTLQAKGRVSRLGYGHQAMKCVWVPGHVGCGIRHGMVSEEVQQDHMTWS